MGGNGIMIRPPPACLLRSRARAAAGGTLVANYTQIGVAVARSSQTGFAAAMARANGVESAVATGAFAVKAPDTPSSDGPVTTPLAGVWQPPATASPRAIISTAKTPRAASGWLSNAPADAPGSSASG